MKQPSSFRTPHSALRTGFAGFAGFTLIEMLVVIAIIGILAGLIVAGATHVSIKGRISRVQAERDALVTAIQSYKKAMGYYPPDSTNNNYMQSSLFYELTGTTRVTSAGQPSFASTVNKDIISTNSVTMIFNLGGFMNSSPDPSSVYNFAPSVAKSGGTATFGYTNGGDGTSGTFSLFGVPVPGPVSSMTNSANGKTINLWHYNSSNPTNSQTYDLWMDVLYGGKTNRISNWSPDPQVVN